MRHGEVPPFCKPTCGRLRWSRNPSKRREGLHVRPLFGPRALLLGKKAPEVAGQRLLNVDGVIQCPDVQEYVLRLEIDGPCANIAARSSSDIARIGRKIAPRPLGSMQQFGCQAARIWRFIRRLCQGQMRCPDFDITWMSSETGGTSWPRPPPKFRKDPSPWTALCRGEPVQADAPAAPKWTGSPASQRARAAKHGPGSFRPA